MSRIYSVLSVMKTSPSFANSISVNHPFSQVLAISDVNDRVYYGLAEGFLQTDIKSFVSEIGLTDEVVYRSLNKLTKLGKIERLGRGKFRIPYPE